MAINLVRVGTPRIEKKELIPEEEVLDEVELEDVKSEEASCSGKMGGEESLRSLLQKQNTLLVDPEFCTLICSSFSFKVNKTKLCATDSVFKEKLKETQTIELDFPSPDAVKTFVSFINESNIPSFHDIYEFKDALHLALRYDLKDYYRCFGLDNLIHFLNKETVLSFLDLVEEYKDGKIYIKDLFSLLKLAGREFRSEFIIAATPRQFRIYLYHSKLTDPSMALTLILQWYEKDPINRVTFMTELMYYTNFRQFTFELFSDFITTYRLLQSDRPLQKNIVEKMLMDQTTIFNWHQNVIDLYALEEFGDIKRKFRWQIDPCYKILKAFVYRNTKYLITSEIVDNKFQRICLWKYSDKFEKINILLFVENSFFVGVTGWRILIVVLSGNETTDDNAETSIYCFDVAKKEQEFATVLNVPFFTNEILCSRSRLYLLRFDEATKHYAGLLRFNFEQRDKQLLSLRSVREKVIRWERATCCNDRLFIFSFDELVQSKAPVEYPRNLMSIFVENPPSQSTAWDWIEREFPWKQLHALLEFYEEEKPVGNEKLFFYPFINFLADDGTLYYLNQDHCWNYEKKRIHLETDLPTDNMTLFLMQN